jgi:hypothetical protein
MRLAAHEALGATGGCLFAANLLQAGNDQFQSEKELLLNGDACELPRELHSVRILRFVERRKEPLQIRSVRGYLDLPRMLLDGKTFRSGAASFCRGSLVAYL